MSERNEILKILGIEGMNWQDYRIAIGSGGNAPDPRYVNENHAPEIRTMIVHIRRTSGRSIQDMAEGIEGISAGVIRRAAYGRAGLEIRETTGMSATQMVFRGIREQCIQLSEIEK